MGSVNTSGQSYTEQSQVTYQCNEGLFPMGVLTATCARDGQNGIWKPDPSTVLCRTSPGSAVMVNHFIYCCLHSQLHCTC